MQEEHLNPQDREVAEALGRLTPARPGVDASRLLFQAGRASVRRGRRAWQALAGMLAAGLAISLAVRPGVQIQQVERIVEVPVMPSPDAWEETAPSAKADIAASSQYLKLRDAVLEHGLSALPESSPVATTDNRELLRSLLGEDESESTQGFSSPLIGG